MKIVEIVKGLLKLATRAEWDSIYGVCYECGEFQKHKEGCKFVEVASAAKEYLHLMEGAKE